MAEFVKKHFYDPAFSLLIIGTGSFNVALVERDLVRGYRVHPVGRSPVCERDSLVQPQESVFARPRLALCICRRKVFDDDLHVFDPVLERFRQAVECPLNDLLKLFPRHGSLFISLKVVRDIELLQQQEHRTEEYRQCSQDDNAGSEPTQLVRHLRPDDREENTPETDYSIETNKQDI